jgi:excinuclease ABC subunit B
VDSEVVLDAATVPDSMKAAIDETERRRQLQLDFNEKHGIEPQTIIKPIKEQEVVVKDTKHIPKAEIPNMLIELEAEMQEASAQLDFERAIVLRDKVQELKKRVT